MEIIQGDCIEEMKKLEDNSVDAVITDPPYGIGFMGKEWDNFKPKEIKKTTKLIYKTDFINGVRVKRKKPELVTRDSSARVSGTYDVSLKGARGFQDFCEEWSKEAFRILKPGGFLLSFCSTRMYHRMTCGIEDAGFEIRDTIMWLYGSGFPKSLNIGKQIDKMQGNEREVVGEHRSGIGKAFDDGEWGSGSDMVQETKGNSEWEGWGTALKPAVEPIVVARKPLSEKNVALNVLKWGTGGINIDECRIKKEEGDRTEYGVNGIERGKNNNVYGKQSGIIQFDGTQGRFPANIILDEEAGKYMPDDTEDDDELKQQTLFGEVLEDENKSASRFFYCAKAGKEERNYGCEIIEEGKPVRWNKGGVWTNDTTPAKNNHPTVKPVKLMEYLVKLVTKEGATVLDPFTGSGTTAIACIKQQRKFIGIEKEEEYIKIINARIKPYLEQTTL